MPFSENEFRSRVKKVRELMQQKGIDLLLIYSDMRMMNGGNVYYISGYYNTLPSLILLPLDKEPSLLVQPGIAQSLLEQAKANTWIQDVRSGVDFANLANEIAKEMSLLTSSVGLDGVSLMDGFTFQRFMNAFPSLLVTEGLVEKVRYIKSEEEIRLIKEAVRLTEIGFECFLNAIKSGRYQREAQAEAYYKAVLYGAEEVYNPMAAGTPWVWASYRGYLKFQYGDMVSSEFNSRYMGYWGQICRVGVLGNPSKEQRDVYNVLLEAFNEMLKKARPGVSGEYLWQVGVKVIKEAGYEYSGLRFGHGLGLTISEGINIGPNEKTILEKGCYLMIHPSIFQPSLAKRGIGAILGDPVIITETGCEELSKYSRELRILE